MQRIFVSLAIVSCVAFFSYCNSSKKAAATPEAKGPTFTWTKNIQPLMVEKCGPCHIKGKGNKLPMGDIEIVKSNIDDIIRRIELSPGERGYMPFKRDKLSDSTIAMVKTWKAENFAQ